jgi:hypothetical protein
MLLLNTTASSLEKDHALENKYNGHKPKERSCSCSYTTASSFEIKDHALVEYNGLKPLNRIIKPMTHALMLTKLTSYQCSMH